MNCLKRLTFSLISFSLINISIYGMEECLSLEHSNNSLESLQQTVAHQLVSTHLEVLFESIHLLSADCKALVARAYYQHNGYVEYKSLSSTQKLFVRKLDNLERTSNHWFNYRPTRHPKNPFLVKSDDKKVQFGFTYKEKYFDCAKDRTDEMRLHEASLEGSEKEKYRHRMIWSEYLDYRRPGEPHDMRGPGSEDCLCAGPNNNNFIIKAVDRDISIYAPVECGKIRWGQTSILEYYSKVEKLKEVCYIKDPATAVTICHNLDDAFAAFQSKKVFYVERWTEAEEYNRQKYFKSTLHLIKLPIDLDEVVIDMHTSQDDEYLWLLTSSKLYRYHIESQALELAYTVPLIPSEEVIELDGGLLAAKEDVLPEKAEIFTFSPDEHYIFIGGSEGTVLLVELATQNCYIIDQYPPQGIADIWWNYDNQVVILSRSGKVHSYTMALGVIESCTFQEPIYKDPSLQKKEPISLEHLIKLKQIKRSDTLFSHSHSHDIVCPEYGLELFKDKLLIEMVESAEYSPNKRLIIITYHDGTLFLVDLHKKAIYHITVLAPEKVFDATWTVHNQLWIIAYEAEPYTEIHRIYTIKINQNVEPQVKELPSWDKRLKRPCETTDIVCDCFYLSDVKLPITHETPNSTKKQGWLSSILNKLPSWLVKNGSS